MVMDSWMSIYNAQMANNIVKWWKSKFLNGYKQFPVECGDAKVSDTDELLSRSDSEEGANERLRASYTTPPPRSRGSSESNPASSKGSTAKKHQLPLNFEGFSCDVSVENGSNKTFHEIGRQEFSFTLYDFDGHGKITKDDIAGLVTTIYEALGSSVKVPHYGSKTIKVKLTVSPDQSATLINQKDEKHDTSIRYKKDLNVTIRQGSNNSRCRRRSKSSRKHHCCDNNHDQDEDPEDQDNHSEDSSDVCSRLSVTSDDDDDNDEEKGEYSDSDERATTNNKTKKHCIKDNKPGYKISDLLVQNWNDNCVKTGGTKKRSGSLQRQELLEIIQANMDKNNISFQTSRKHVNHPDIVFNNKEPITGFKQSKTNVSTSALHYLANIVDPTRFYVDLAALQKTTRLPQTHHYDKLIDAVMCVTNKRIALGKQNCRRHNSVRTEQYQFLHYPIINDGTKNNKPKNVARNIDKSDMKDRAKVANGHTSSPHHLRHRNRQEDQARAMAQVVRWLEQEFSTKEKKKRTKTSDGFNKKSNENPTNNSAGIERHEHHHVHEHIHHHYHHYQESTPPVV